MTVCSLSLHISPSSKNRAPIRPSWERQILKAKTVSYLFPSSWALRCVLWEIFLKVFGSRVNLTCAQEPRCLRLAWWTRSFYIAISRKVVGKSARDHPERYCGWFCVHSSSSRKFERVAREAMDLCLRVLKKSSKSRFDNYSVRNSVLIISHITFRNCRVHIFSDNLSRNSCIRSSIG